jgi:hypothetical protein
VDTIKLKIHQRLQRIANVLLLNASFIDNIGLLNGKMGIAIFFYQYGRYSNNKIYTDYAGELIDEIYEEINTNTSIDFVNGLTGIGWGIGYLIENKFVDADSDEALAEIDDAVYSSMLNSPVLHDNGNDLFGYGLYFISRLGEHENNEDNPATIIKKKHLADLIDECERLLLDKQSPEFNIPRLSTAMVNSILWFLLEMERLGLFLLKVRKVLKYLADYIFYNHGELNRYTDISIFHELAQKASELLTDLSLKEQYLALVIRTKNELKNHSTINESALAYLKSITLQKLIYNSCINGSTVERDVFEKAFEIIDNEDEWTRILDGLNKSSFGLTGLAGAGLLLMDTIDLHNLNDMHDLQDNLISRSATH